MYCFTKSTCYDFAETLSLPEAPTMTENMLSIQHILTNYYTFGSLIVTVLIGILSIFFLTLKDKTQSTKHLGLACFFLSLFQFGYLVGAFYYHPIAAYHRWFTGGFILFGIIHFGQFFFRFPNNEDKKIADILLYITYAIASIVVIWFLIQTSSSEKKTIKPKYSVPPAVQRMS